MRRWTTRRVMRYWTQALPHRAIAGPGGRLEGHGQGGTPAGGGAVYGLGMIGAAAYFFGSAESGRDYVLAVPKAIFWPTLLVYKLLRYLSA